MARQLRHDDKGDWNHVMSSGFQCQDILTFSKRNNRECHRCNYDPNSHNGNITDYISQSGTLAAHYTYDPFGQTLTATGSLAAVFRYRFYSSSLARWLNRDPMGEEGGLNLYVFSENNPINKWDYLGLSVYWDNYPNYNAYTTSKVWEKVGGGLLWFYYKGIYENSCALRVSISIINSGKTIAAGYGRNLNNNYTIPEDIVYAGNTIPKGTVLKAEKPNARYVVSAALIETMLTEVFGKGPTTSWTNKKDAEGLKNAIEKNDKEAFFVTDGHVGMIKKGYNDPYFPFRDKGKIWCVD